MKLFLSILTLCLIACGGNAPTQETAPTLPIATQVADVDAMRNKTIILARKVEDVYVVYCSGVWVSATQILTAHHCVVEGVLRKMDPDDAQAVLDGEQELPSLEGHTLYYRTYADYVRDHELPTSQRARNIKVVAVEKATDLALLEVTGPVPAHEIVSLRNGDLKDGSFVWAVGHSAGMQFTISHGVVSASRRDADLTVLQVSVPVSGGNSGGGVYDNIGNLVGIVSAMHRSANQITFATHRDSIKDFVDANGGLK